MLALLDPPFRRAARRAVTVALPLVMLVGAGRAGAGPTPPSAAARAGSSVSAAVAAPAADVAGDLAQAEKLYADLEYAKANLLAAKVSGGTGLTHDQLTRALRVLALTDAALGQVDQAREEFIELLTYAPDFQVDPNLGPRVTAPFLEARGFWRARPEKPGMEVAATVHANGPGTLRVVTRDPTHIVKTGTVGFRWGSSAPYTTLPLTVTGTGDGSILDVPPRPADAARLDYYAQAFDDRGNAVMEVGNPTSPKSALVEAPAAIGAGKPSGGKSLFASPLFWTVAGVVVAGAATATYFLTRPASASGATLTGAAACGSTDASGAPAMPCR